MKQIGLFFIFMITLSCGKFTVVDTVKDKDYAYVIESINLVLRSNIIDSLNWEIQDYIVSSEAIPFKRNGLLFREILESQENKLELKPLSIEEIMNEKADLFENNLSTNQKSAFNIFFSTIFEGYYTVEILQWYEGEKLSFKDLSLYQGESAIFLFKYLGNNKKPLLIDEAIVNYN